MPWEFKGANKNPLRFETVHANELPAPYRTSKDGRKLNPKHHRLVLGPLEAMFAVAVLSETVQKLNIFLAKVPPIEPKFEFSDIKLKAIEPLTIETIETDEYKCIQRKISLHMVNMKTLLHMIKDELLLNEELAGLYFYNDHQYCSSLEETKIADEHQLVSERVIKATKSLHEAQEMCESTGLDLASKLATVEAGFEEACSLTTIMREYSMKFRKARIEQNILKIKKFESEHKRELYSRLKAIEDEHSANQLIVRYLNQATEELEQKHSEWSMKYDTDVEEIDLRIARNDQEIPELVSNLAQLLTSYYARELEMSHYIRWRDWYLKVKEIECFLEFMARTIQAWWRGTMVRWEIGPYSPKKRKRKLLTPSTPTTILESIKTDDLEFH